MTVQPGQKGIVAVEEVPHPDLHDGALLVRGKAIGVCGTDRGIADGAYGTPPPSQERLTVGHESLGEVLEAPAGSGFAPGDLIVGISRRPDPVPCSAWAAGEWDMCRNDGFGELITRPEPLASWTEALDRQPEDIRVVAELTA